MIYYPDKVPMTDRQQEIIISQSQDFPYVAMEANMDLYAGRCSPWHWHDFYEFAFVIEGAVRVTTQAKADTLYPGDGYFVNANVLHHCQAVSVERCVLHTQLFSRDMLMGSGLVGRKYVLPVENCVPMEFLPLRGEIGMHSSMLAALRNAFSEAEMEGTGHEMRISGQLMRLWELVYAFAEPMLKIENPPPREDSARTKKMLDFIHMNYGESIAVRDIAAAAGICERECYRCFENVLDTTPQAYLTRHRINCAARMLAETDAPVGRIAGDCGFTGASYFGKVFRSIMGCSPREFRRGQ